MDYSELFQRLRSPSRLSFMESLYLNISAISKLYSEGFSDSYEPSITDDFCREDKVLNMLDLLSQTPGYKLFKWMYSPEMHGIENIPGDGALLVSNHSTIYMGDVAPIYMGMYENKRRVVYGLGHNILKHSDFMKTVGNVHGKKDIAIRLLNEGKFALSCPEGIMGAAAPWYHSYCIRNVEGFSSSGMGYLKVAFRAGKPIVPIASIGGEETAIILGNIRNPVKSFFDGIDKVLKIYSTSLGRRMHDWVEDAKIIPLLASPPIKSSIDAYVGHPIDVSAFVDKNERPHDYYLANLHVMRSLQELIDDNLKNLKGLKGYFFRSLRKVQASL